MIPNFLDSAVRRSRFQETSDSGNLPVARLVHQVQHHVVRLAMDIFLTGTVKVKLRQLVALIAEDEKIAATGCVVVHPDRMTVVDDVLERTAVIFKA